MALFSQSHPELFRGNSLTAWVQLAIEPYRSTTVVPTLERAFDFDTFTICFVSKDSERNIEHKNMGSVEEETMGLET